MTTEWNLNFPGTGNDVILFQRNLQHSVAIYNGRLGVSSCCVAFRQCCYQSEMCGILGCSAVWVQETNMLSVHSFENGFGDSDGHLVLKATDEDTLC